MMALSGVRSSWLMLETNCDLFWLPVLVLDFVEQPHVLDRDRGLVRKGGSQFDLLLGERSHCHPGQRKHADWGALSQHRNGDDRAEATQPLVNKGVITVGLDVRNVNSPA